MDILNPADSPLLRILLENHDALQILICTLGTFLGLGLILFVFVRNNAYIFVKLPVTKTIFILLLIIGCLSYVGPFGTLNGDGAVHQAKIWFVAQSILHGTMPEWSFFWFGGGLISECYGPLYYIIFAIPMVLAGISTKWSIALIMLGCFAWSAAIVVRTLTPRYGFFAASLAAGCHLLSPARSATYWYDGTPHRIVIVFICLLYILYLWRNISIVSPWKIGLFLGLASTSSVYFHLQIGGIATAIMFMFTAVTMTFNGRPTLLKPASACLIGLLVFLPTAGPHYLYYFSAKPDLVAEADSLRYMVASSDQWLSNFLVASIWDWKSSTWDTHYLGFVPLSLSVLAVAFLFAKDRFSFFSGAFALLIYAAIPFVPRITAFAPLFFVPTVAAIVYHLNCRLADLYQKQANTLSRRFGVGIALVCLLDIYPSNFQLPYRPGWGDQPVAEVLAAMGPIPGRVVVVAADKQYPNMSADRFKDFPQVNSASVFGPTFQLGTKMLGYEAMIATQAWRDVERTGAISSRIMDYFSLLDISDVLVYKRNDNITRVRVSNFRPAWRIDQFTCDRTEGTLTKLNWDDIRAVGLGEKDVSFDNEAEIVIDTMRGAVRGIRVDCGEFMASERWANASGLVDDDKVTAPQYNEGMSFAEFTVDTSRSGLFLLPFGYTRDIRVEKDGEPIAVRRTDEWMSVVVLPAGHSVIRITAQPHQTAVRRAIDGLFIIVLISIAFRSIPRDWRRFYLAGPVSTEARK